MSHLKHSIQLSTNCLRPVRNHAAVIQGTGIDDHHCPFLSRKRRPTKCHFVHLLILLLLSACLGQTNDQQCIKENITAEKFRLSTGDYARLESPPFRNRDREDAVVQYFFEACPQVQLQRINKYSGHNIICRMPGREKKRIIVAAHFDRIGAGRGVADNWSGIVLMSKLITELSKHNLHFTWEVIAFGAEEFELLGSKAYIKNVLREQGASDILAMINVDTVGLDTVKIDSRSDEQLKCLTASLASELGLKLDIVSLPTITGDWEPFRRHGIPVLSIHSLDRRSLNIVHNRKDSIRAISMERLEDAWSLLLNLQRNLDQETIRLSN